jgi:hypothetical protein
MRKLDLPHQTSDAQIELELLLEFPASPPPALSLVWCGHCCVELFPLASAIGSGVRNSIPFSNLSFSHHRLRPASPAAVPVIVSVVDHVSPNIG